MTTEHALALDEGIIRVKIGEVSQELDLWKVNNSLLEILKKHPQNAGGNTCFEALAEYLTELGYPPCPFVVCTRFLNLIFAEAQKLGEAVAGEPKQGSPASTD